MTLRAASIGIIVLVMAAPRIAAAADANPFVGRWHWDGLETCAKDYDSDNVAMQVTPGRLIFYENVCSIRSMRRLGDRFYRLQMTCKGEGEIEQAQILLTFLKKSKVNDEMLLRIEPASGFVQAYRRCP